MSPEERLEAWERERECKARVARGVVEDPSLTEDDLREDQEESIRVFERRAKADRGEDD